MVQQPDGRGRQEWDDGGQVRGVSVKEDGQNVEGKDPFSMYGIRLFPAHAWRPFLAMRATTEGVGM